METKDNNINSKKNIFSRVMIKLSGEALLGNKEFGIDRSNSMEARIDIW